MFTMPQRDQYSRHYVEGDEMKRNNVRYNNNNEEAVVWERYFKLYLPEVDMLVILP